MQIVIPIFDRFTALDAIGPYEVLSRLPDASVHFLGPDAGEIRTDTRMLGLHAEGPWEEIPHPEVVVVPGGYGTRAALADERLLAWLRGAHETSQWTTSVCTGSLVLAAAGLLNHTDAATHWGARELLGRLGARPVAQRVVQRGRIITSAGVSAGIDMALTLAGRIAGDAAAQAIQLVIEYDPQPPYDSGSLEKAPDEVVRLAQGAEDAEDAAG